MITTIAKYTARYTSRAARSATNVARATPGQAAKAASASTRAAAIAASASGSYLKNVATTASSEWKKEFSKGDTA